MTQKSKLSEIKKGDKLSMTYYLNVLEVNHKNSVLAVEDQNGMQFQVNGKDLIEKTITSAHQYTEVISLSRTDIVSILEGAGDSVFSVNFNKLPTGDSLSDLLSNASIGDLQDSKKLKKLAKQAMLGEERTLIGHLVSSEPKMGRTQVIDLEVAKGQHNLRQIDNRTINWLILKGTKYIVK